LTIALAARSGVWEPRAIASAIAGVFELDEPWMRALARRMVRRFPEAPTPDALTAFVRDDPRAGLARMRLARHPPLTLPSMEPSPFGAPPITTSADLAELLEIPLVKLDWLADLRGTAPLSDERVRHYHARWIPKRGEGHRLIEAPKRTLRDAQRRLLDRVLAHVSPHEAAHGFVPGRSVIGHARAHTGRAIVLRLDLEDFFLSVSGAKVRAIYSAVGYSKHIAALLTGLSTARSPRDVVSSSFVTDWTQRRRLMHRHLPQGAPTSPGLANLAAWRLDRRLSALASSLGATYTRYADDLAISGDEHLAWSISRALPLVGAIAIEEGFALQHRKTRVMRRGVSQRLCGLVVNEGTHVSRRERDRLEAILVNCARHGPASQNRAASPHFREHLAGRIGWVTQASPRHGEALRAIFDLIEWP
jgi:hypothetical protein